MRYVLNFLLTGILLFCSFRTQAQTETEDTTGVILFSDPRLDVVMASLKPGGPAAAGGKSGVIRSGRGFRVQIYNGNNRHKANEIKVNFMRRFPAIPAYISYIQPQFRVKVGNFRSRQEAMNFLDQLGNLYNPVMIVPDIIIINTFKND